MNSAQKNPNVQLQCVVLAGGLGTRLGNQTMLRPKALVPVHGIPFLKYQLDWLQKAGIERVTFSLGHMADQIQDYLGTIGNPGLIVDTLVEPAPLLGTGGALRFAFDQGRLESDFILLYGDSYLPIDPRAIWVKHRESGRPALMTVFKNNGRFDKSNAEYRDGLVPYYSKTDSPGRALEYIDYGLSVINRDLIPAHFPPGEKQDLSILFSRLSQAGQLSGVEVFERFYEIGSPQGLADFAAYAGRHLTLN